MGVGVAVAHGLAGHDGAEAVLEGVDGRRPHAARGRGSGDDEGVYAGGGEEAGEACAEEAGGEELVEDGLRLSGSYARVDLGPAGSGLQGEERRNLVYEGGGRELVRLAVGDGGEDDWVSPPRRAASRSFCISETGPSRSQARGDSGSVNPRVMSMTTRAGRRPKPPRPPKPSYVRQGVILRWPAPCRARPRATR